MGRSPYLLRLQKHAVRENVLVIVKCAWVPGSCPAALWLRRWTQPVVTAVAVAVVVVMVAVVVVEVVAAVVAVAMVVVAVVTHKEGTYPS